MNKMILIVAFIATLFSMNSKAQEVQTISSASDMLTHYYHIKDGLVKGNAGVAAESAQELVKVINSMNKEIIPGSSRVSLLTDAGKIASNGDIKKQREYFATVSELMIDLAKAIKLSTDPVNIVYCPMKKSSWLSKEAIVRNPYYGSSMLSCGKVVETIK